MSRRARSDSANRTALGDGLGGDVRLGNYGDGSESINLGITDVSVNNRRQIYNADRAGTGNNTD